MSHVSENGLRGKKRYTKESENRVIVVLSLNQLIIVTQECTF